MIIVTLVVLGLTDIMIQANSLRIVIKFQIKSLQKNYWKLSFIVEKLQEVIDKLQAINPKLKVIFTISPVRHWKDGAEENTLSKSILNVAIHQLV